MPFLGNIAPFFLLGPTLGPTELILILVIVHHLLWRRTVAGSVWWVGPRNPRVPQGSQGRG